MRTRSRSVVRPIASPVKTTFTWDYLNEQFPDGTSESFNHLDNTYVSESSSISDVIAVRPQVFVDPNTGRWEWIKYPRQTGHKAFRPVHPCVHTKTKFVSEKDITLTWGGIEFPGNGIFQRTVAYTRQYPDAASFFAEFHTPNFGPGFLESFGRTYESQDFLLHDWFALADSFYEACDQFIPSSFLLGEDIAQSSIFVDALKAVINPTRAIKIFIDMAMRFVKKSKSKNLGQISRDLARGAADTHLSYIFGIKPAIEDIRATLSAHQKVTARMRHLSLLAGRFTPIRVRKPLVSSFENTTPVIDPGGSREYLYFCKDKRSIATISAWGRVREDLDFGDTWSAYLQYFGINKVVGLAWELIPFSFVVDWFTNAQERINYYTRLRTGGPFTEIKGMSASVKQVLVEELYQLPFRHQGLGWDQTDPLEPTKLGELTTSSYQRFLNIPSAPNDFDWSAFGPYRYTALGSLLIQRLVR